jgi:predicted DNA-binding transcriptional regulator YafY
VTASDQLSRIVQLVAELSRAESRGAGPPTLETLARSFGVTPADIAADIRTLTLLGEHSDADWLLSLSAWQQEGRVGVSSAGPFRRPVRLTPEELLALRVALATEPGGEVVAGKLGAAGQRGGGAGHPAIPPSRHPADLLTNAIAEQRAVELRYAGEGERDAATWLLHPHQLVDYRDRTYLIAWAPQPAAWRHFRLDRILEARPTDDRFAPRDDFAPVRNPADLFRAPDDAVDQVVVRFSPGVARWVRERYAGCRDLPDGGVEVGFRASSPDWLVRRVLEYGPDAEVVEPAAYREAVRRAVMGGHRRS